MGDKKEMEGGAASPLIGWISGVGVASGGKY